jgi:hypothetical protein
MRKIILILPVFLLLAARSFAQASVELIPTFGFTFADRSDFYGAYGRIGDNPSFGGSIKFNVNRSFGIEVLYSHMSTNNGLYNYGPDQTPIQQYNLNFDYIMAGPVESFTIPNSTVRPFIGALLGAAILTPGASSGYSQDTRFAVGFQLGTNIYFSPRLGLQLKAQLLSPVDGGGGGVYFGSYNGAGVDTYSSLYQFSLSGGLIIGLGRVLPAEVYRQSRRPGPRHYRYYY